MAADEATRLIERSCKIHWQNLGPSLSINQLRHLIPTKWNNVFYLSSSAAVSFWRGKPQSSLAPEREKKRKNAIRLIAYGLSSNVHKLKRRRQLRSTGNPSSMGGLLRQRRVSSAPWCLPAQQPVICIIKVTKVHNNIIYGFHRSLFFANIIIIIFIL